MSLSAELARKLTKEQMAFVTSRNALVTACPGSGKTLTVASRFLNAQTSRGSGIAILTFTQRAANELASRCLAHQGLVASPNFIGTFDAFLRIYILNPHFARNQGMYPSYWPSWKEFPGTRPMVFAGRAQGSGIGLWNFRRSATGIVALDEDLLSWEEKSYLNQVSARGIPKRTLEQNAQAKINSLLESGALDAAGARWHAARILQGDSGADIRRRLAYRFREIIVDEAQDCDEFEFLVLEALSQQRSVVSIVADPDQAIYEFRGGQPEQLKTLRESLNIDEELALSSCFRSSAAVCAATTSLSSSHDRIDSAGGGAENIFVFSGPSIDAYRQPFLALASDLGIQERDCVALAYQNAHAALLAHKDVPNTSTSAKCKRVIRDCMILESDGETPSARYAAIERLQRTILECLAWRTDQEFWSTSRWLNELQKPPIWIRLLASRVISILRSSATAHGFAKEMRQLLNLELSNLAIPARKLGSILKSPDVESWNQWQMRKKVGRALQNSTIHRAKGGEWEAVLLYVSETSREKQALLDWKVGADSEARRVLYVGASRAKKLLVIAIAPSMVSDLSSILDRDGVPYKVVPLEPNKSIAAEVSVST